MKHPAKLSKSFVERVPQPGRFGDGRGGHGLSLLVKPRASGGWAKSWSQRIIIDEKICNLGLGPYPLVSLEEAREAALRNRRMVWQGRDPRRKESKVPTFAEVANKVIAIHAESWRDNGKSAAQWRASLRDYAMPVIGNKRIDRIGTADVLAVLTPIWTSKRETARRVRQRIGAMMKWAVAAGLRDDNPAGDAIGEALPKNGQHRKQHRRALPHGEVSAALATVGGSNAYPQTVYALEFLTLTATRSGEVRGAKWDEIDLESKTWTIPPERMKTGVEHRVPLSTGALAVLEKARELGGGSGLVFPSTRRGKPLSDNTISKLMREQGINCVPHGLRSSFRDWAAESGVSRDVAEAALAHMVKSQVEAAYFRSDLLAARVKLIQDWSNYLGY